jgi:hypothetical protein
VFFNNVPHKVISLENSCAQNAGFELLLLLNRRSQRLRKVTRRSSQRDVSRVRRAAQVSYDDASGPRSKVVEGRRALRRSRVKNDLVALVDERPRSGTSQAVRAAGDEDCRHAAMTR